MEIGAVGVLDQPFVGRRISPGCLSEVEHCKLILEQGSSAHHQLRAYREAGDDVRAVTKWIASGTAPDQSHRQAPPWHEAVI